MLTANFGIEIEFTGITREKAAEVAASFLNGTYEEAGTYYDTKKVTAPDGRVWKFMSDGSINCQRKSQGRRVAAGRDYSVELVSPIPFLPGGHCYPAGASAAAQTRRSLYQQLLRHPHPSGWQRPLTPQH
jgi:Putative amidoligase enzyme.